MPVPSLTGKKPPKKAPAAPQPPAAPERWYVVLEDRQVPRPGSGMTLLRAGKEIRSGSYDVRALLASGAKLREIPPPAWFVDEQTRAEPARRAALEEAGVELPDAAPWEPTPLEAAPPAPAAPA